MADDGRLRVGYISLDERIPYVRTLSAGIREEAARAGVALVECDAASLAERALDCAGRLRAAGVRAVISSQPYAARSAEICAAYGDLPTIAVAFPQEPCQVAFAGPDEASVGEMVGSALGRFAKERWACDITAFVSLEPAVAGTAADARTQGFRTGYAEACPLDATATRALKGADRVATAKVQVARLLDQLPGRRIVVAGLNEDAVSGALQAAAAAGRPDDVWVAGVGSDLASDPALRQAVACDDRYVASAAFFPRALGSLVLPAAVDAAEGRAVPTVIEAPVELVTAANVRQLFPDTPACDR